MFAGIATSQQPAREKVIVTAFRANLTGTPTSLGAVVTTVSKGERFDLIKEEGAWYLVQTPVYVGWLHRNTIEKEPAAPVTDFDKLYDKYIRQPEQPSRPKTTTKPLSTGDTPFKSEYVGIDYTIIRIVNNANRTLNLTFGGLKYVIPNGEERTIEADGGNYEFFASAPGVRSASGVKTFSKGYKYSWTFYIVRR
jgi:hypothetical protein